MALLTAPTSTSLSVFICHSSLQTSSLRATADSDCLGTGCLPVQSKAFSRRLSLKHPQPPGHCSYLQFVTDCKDINAITWQSSIYFLKRSSCLCDWAISELKFDSYCCNLSKLCCLSKHRRGREVGFTLWRRPAFWDVFSFSGDCAQAAFGI